MRKDLPQRQYIYERTREGANEMNPKVKRVIHIFLKIFIIFFILTTAINILLLLILYVNNQSKLDEEKVYLQAPGTLVETTDGKMHVYVSGNEESDTTLVFMHSSNVVDDSIALQPMLDKLSDYRLVVIDRLGYGFSEETDSSRDIDTILEDSRQALKAANITGSVILVPTGTAGIEAIHWANKYPSEVSGIFGINMNYPEEFEGTSTDEYCGFFDWIMVRFCKIGGIRLVSSAYPDNDYANYTELQMKTRKALVSKGAYTETMYLEDFATVDNAAKVVAEGWPKDLKMTLVYANPLMDPYVSSNASTKEQYEDALETNSDKDYVTEYNKPIREYFEDYANVTVKEMSGPARLYTYAPADLANEITTYVSSLNDVESNDTK